MKQTRFLALLLALCILLSSLVSCAQPEAPQPNNGTENSGTENNSENNTESNDSETTKPELSITYELSVKRNTQHTAEQKQYLNSKTYDTLPDGINGKTDEGAPESIILRWTRRVDGEYKKPTECAVISEDESFSDPIRINSTNSQVEIYNLEIGKTFYWYVEGKIGSQIFKSNVQSFTTDSAAPRNLAVDGVTNCRDLGGWKTTDGKVLKQGQIFRSGRLTKIKSAGETVILNDLGIKSEIDLRTEYHVLSQGDSTEVSHIGKKIKYFFLPMDDAGKPNILTAEINNDSLLGVFEVLGDEANYPILFHCNIGTDRTGLIAFLILGLCGVSEKDIYRDYMFSGFGKIDKTPNFGAIERYLKIVKEASGKTLAEKVENYLLGRGVTAAQIATIKKMMR